MMRLSPKHIIKLISYWPPYLFSGIKVIGCNNEVSEISVRLKSYPWNKNYFGTHFGGSLYAMCDPFFVFILAQKLGKDHIIWDKAAEIEFLKATNKPVFAHFKIPSDEVEKIREGALKSFKVEPKFFLTITDQSRTEIARVEKTLYVRRKDAKERFAQSK